MALDTVIYPHDPFIYRYKELEYLNNRSYDEFGIVDEHQDIKGLVGISSNKNIWDYPVSSQEVDFPGTEKEQVAVVGRRKRQRSRSSKNKEELENQRMTHIAVERNRRKQMNEYLATMQSLMPNSYVPRGDQASIIGGAINYVKELEHQLQSLEAQKMTATVQKLPSNDEFSPVQLFSGFFRFPQYSSSSGSASADEQSRYGLADIEVSVADSHASLKVLTKKQPKQLLKLVAGLQSQRLTILHLNVTTVDHRALYSLSVKIEEGCQLTSVEEIADAVNHLLGRIDQEARLS